MVNLRCSMVWIGCHLRSVAAGMILLNVSFARVINNHVILFSLSQNLYYIFDRIGFTEIIGY